MAKILIISNYYPPIQSVATNRIVSFEKYLKKFGHEITILTIGNSNKEEYENGTRVLRVVNSSFLKIMDTNKKENWMTHYLKCVYNLILMQFLEDEYEGWVKNAIKKLLNMRDAESFDFVISSYPIMGTMVVANVLKSRNSKIKWIADMRDAIWSPGGSKQRQKHLESQFNKIKKNIDVLLAVSKPQVENYEKLLISTKTKLLEVRNGYDFEVNKLGIEKTKNDFFTIVYSGSFYGKIKPKNFFIALNRILEKYDFKIKVRIIGNKAPINILQPLVRVVKEENTMPYEKLINELKFNADALLMILPKELEKGIYTGKIFDYLGCCKPIIGLVPKEDVAAKLINDVRLGYVAENESIEEIENIIVKAYKDWENDVQFTPNLEMIKKHHRREQATRLNKIILSMTE